MFQRKRKREHEEEYQTTRTTPNSKGVSHYLPHGAIEVNADTLICTGGRNSGKSTGWATWLVENALQTEECFLYARNEAEEVTQNSIIEYFESVRFQDGEVLKEYDEIFVNRFKEIFVRAINEETGEVERETYVGKAISIDKAISYKSKKPRHGTHHLILIEEMGNIKKSSAELYWNNYASILSTFGRHVERFKVICVSNKVDRNNVMHVRYNLPAVDKSFPTDVIRVYTIMSDPPIFDNKGKQMFSRVAVENVENLGDRSNVLIGAGLQVGIQDDDYEEDQHALISDTRNRDILHRCFLIEDTLKFKMLLVINRKGHLYWEVYHTYKDIPTGARIITNFASTNPLHTQGLIPLSEGEKRAFQLILDGKVFFKNNLVGTEFNRAIERM